MVGLFDSGFGLLGQSQTQPQSSITDALDPNIVKAAWQRTAAPLAARAGIPMPWLSGLAQSESGNRNVRQQINPTGTAFGPFQFTEGTWNNLIAQHPELGLGPQDRMSPAAQGLGVVALTRDNANTLQQGLGRPPTQGELTLAHRFGAGGALALLQSKPGQTVGKILPAAASANPQWANLTADDLLSDSFDDTEDPETHLPAEPQSRLSGGALGNMAATPVTSGGGLADLLGGTGIAPMPFGTGLQNMTPQMREILQIALSDPNLGPHALTALIQMGGMGSAQGMVTPAERARLAVEMQGQQQRTDVAKQRLQTYQSVQQRIADQQQQAQQLQQKRLELAYQQAMITPAQKDAASLGLKPGTDSYNKYIEQRTMPNSPEALAAMAATLATKLQTSGVQTKVQKDWDAAIDGGWAASNTLDQLKQLEQLNGQIQTGRFAGTTKDVLNLAQSLGIDTTALGVKEGAAPYEAFQALASNMAMHLRNPPGQTNLMPGQMSNYEDQLLQGMGPQLQKTPQGNQIMIEVQKRLNQRAMDFRDFAIEHQSQNNGVVTPSWFKESRDWWTSHPLMTPELKARIDQLSQAPGPAVQGGGTVPPGLQGVTSTSPQRVAPQGASPAVIKSDDEYNALPSGSVFIGPDGKQRRKP